MLVFFKTNSNRIIDASIQPDIRRYIYEDEGPNHYIDLELYGDKEDSILFMSWDEAANSIGVDSLVARGILPWAIVRTYYRLTDAFRDKNTELILRYSADLCQYISDAHVPLHTTYNYDGQYTGQEGIHRLWESLIPELSSEKYSYWVGKAEYRENIYAMVRKVILDSHSRQDSVLTFEKVVSGSIRSDQKYAFERRGRNEVKQYSKEFIELYEKELNGMVEHQLRASIKATGDLWYTSWIEAGQPDLSSLITSEKQSGNQKEVSLDSAKTTSNRARIHN